MDDLYKQLDDLVVRKTALYSQFIDLLKQEWKQIAENKLSQLEITVQRKEALVEELDRFNRVRESILALIAQAKGLDVRHVTLKDIIQMPDNPRGRNMAGCRKVLRSQIARINELNQANRDLIRQASRTAKDSMEYLYHGGPSRSPYQAGGGLEEAPMASRMVSTSA